MVYILIYLPIKREPFISLTIEIIEFPLIYMTKEVIIYGFNYNIVKISFLHDINSCS